MIERAAILSTGDEITTGKVVDTNSNYIADKLIEAGLDVTSIVTVGDVPERIIWAWEQAMQHADVIISTGGIGPTADDLTTELVAKVAGLGPTPRFCTDYIVTEYGAARMKGKDLRGRAEALIEIAHPDFRPELEQSLG